MDLPSVHGQCCFIKLFLIKTLPMAAGSIPTFLRSSSKTDFFPFTKSAYPHVYYVLRLMIKMFQDHDATRIYRLAVCIDD